jgi:CheY-like chemotaxis protein
MRADPEVLVLEDDPETLEELRRHLAGSGFHPLAVRSAARAVSLLRDGGPASHPVAAIVDWDLSMAPDRSATSADALSVLAGEAPDCLTLVYSANVDHFQVRSEIHRAHPRAWLHDKREGVGSLVERIGRMLERSVADLRVSGGRWVVHTGTGDEYRHREAVRLLIRHPEVVTLHSDSAARAVRRFARWLELHGSRARVVSQGNRRYRLSVDAAATGAGGRAS